MHPSVGLESLAVRVPERVLTRANQLGLSAQEDDRDTVAPERRVLEAGDSALDLEAAAARQALSVAGLGAADVDLLICTSFPPDAHGIGGATFLARELELEGHAWNLEAASSSAVVAFQTACSLVASGQHRKALVVTSGTCSRVVPADDPMSLAVGDAATAMVVGPVADGAGLLGGHTVNSAETGGGATFCYELDEQGKPTLRLCARPHAGDAVGASEGAHDQILECCHRALDKAGIAREAVDRFVCSTPLDGYAAACAQALGVDPDRMVSVYPLYADAGPALLGLNLHHAARWQGFQAGEVVLLYAAGSVSSCSAAVVRWSEVALGPMPEGVTEEHLASLERPVAVPVPA